MTRYIAPLLLFIIPATVYAQAPFQSERKGSGLPVAPSTGGAVSGTPKPVWEGKAARTTDSSTEIWLRGSEVASTSPKGFTATIDAAPLKSAPFGAWNSQVNLTSAPFDLGATPPKPTSIRIIFKPQKEGPATASLAGEGDRVILPWELVVGAHDLARTKGDKKTQAVTEAIIRTTSADAVQYSWGSGFFEISPVPGQTEKRALAVDDPRGEIKTSLDTYLASYLFLNFARYAKSKEERELFRELSERLLTKDVASKWLERTSP